MRRRDIVSGISSVFSAVQIERLKERAVREAALRARDKRALGSRPLHATSAAAEPGTGLATLLADPDKGGD